jgi:hypothetical protein
MMHKNIFFKHEMIRWKDRNDRFRTAFVNMEQWKQDAGRGFLVEGLNDNGPRCSGGKLAPNFAEFEVLSGDNYSEALGSYHSLRPMTSMLKHRSAADEIDVLFRQIIASPLMDKVPESRAVSC